MIGIIIDAAQKGLSQECAEDLAALSVDCQNETEELVAWREAREIADTIYYELHEYGEVISY